LSCKIDYPQTDMAVCGFTGTDLSMSVSPSILHASTNPAHRFDTCIAG